MAHPFQQILFPCLRATDKPTQKAEKKGKKYFVNNLEIGWGIQIWAPESVKVRKDPVSWLKGSLCI